MARRGEAMMAHMSPRSAATAADKSKQLEFESAADAAEVAAKAVAEALAAAESAEQAMAEAVALERQAKMLVRGRNSDKPIKKR